MPIIKDQQILENTWTFVEDDAPLTSGDITVSVTRWTQEKAALLQHSGKVGIRLAPADDVASLGDELPFIKLIELNFPAFTDGRTFSQARLLKNRYNYQGEIRAIGNYMADQVFYLHRVGVDSFEFNNPKDMELALSAIKDFSVRYQASTY
ncbi:DUF934 domain-containing protein [Methylomonas methanica]|uniref:Uncharacterized conserved protein UCP030820 n=1 Tax=Methylomonas methanica (strain DSM 25384 / MC09) TaxID=857087 RepID=F9ZZR6_METMM|nr:DUF934 domain-containing protein [Methylomonas methanica]AEF98725.1 Uncharacterized conserved protein UCP030820 [Methylomonas methanica MC09]